MLMLSYRVNDHNVRDAKNDNKLRVEASAVVVAEPNREYCQRQCEPDPMVKCAFVGHESLGVPSVAL